MTADASLEEEAACWAEALAWRFAGRGRGRGGIAPASLRGKDESAVGKKVCQEASCLTQ